MHRYKKVGIRKECFYHEKEVLLGKGNSVMREFDQEKQDEKSFFVMRNKFHEEKEVLLKEELLS